MKHKQFIRRISKKVLAGAMTVVALPAIALAQAYGQGAYNTVAYSTGQLQVGPITLPNTGATWVGLVCTALALIIGIVLIVRSLRRSHHTTQ